MTDAPNQPPDLRDFGTRIRELREETGLTRGEVAVRLDFGETTLGRLERGERVSYRPATLADVATLYGLTADDVSDLIPDAKLAQAVIYRLGRRNALAPAATGTRLKGGLLAIRGSEIVRFEAPGTVTDEIVRLFQSAGFEIMTPVALVTSDAASRE